MVLTGIDVGGSSIKGACVDVSNATLTTPMLTVATPDPSTPAAVGDAIAGLVAQLPGNGSVGVAVPSVVKRGIAHTAANIDASWIGADVESLVRNLLRRPVVVLNDADAAGIAEMRLGAGRAHEQRRELRHRGRWRDLRPAQQPSDVVHQAQLDRNGHDRLRRGHVQRIGIVPRLVEMDLAGGDKLVKLRGAAHMR